MANTPKRSRGRPKVRITDPEQYDTIRAMAAAGAGKIHIAAELGMAPASFRRLLDRDSKAADAFREGQETDFDTICAALRVTALDPQNSKQVAAAQLLAKLKFGANVDQQPTIAINLPAPMSPEQFAKAVEVIPQRPQQIEHHETERKPQSIADLLGRRHAAD